MIFSLKKIPSFNINGGRWREKADQGARKFPSNRLIHMPCYSLPGAVKNSPLQTTSPTTYLIPSIFAIPNLFCSLISVIHIAKASPATTGFLNLCLSQQKKFYLKPPTSGHKHKEFYLSWYIPQSTRCRSLITFSKREYHLLSTVPLLVLDMWDIFAS